MTGKAMVPIVASGGGWDLDAPGPATTSSRPRTRSRRWRSGSRDRGYYPIRLTRDEVDAWAADPDARRRPVQGRDARHRRALDGARRRAPGRARGSAASSRRPTTTCSRSTRSSQRAEHRRARRGQHDRARRLHAGLDRLGEPDAVEHVPRAARGPSSGRGSTGSSRTSPDPHRAIFNFHAPPYGSNLDNAPKLDADMNYVSGGQALVPSDRRPSATRSSRTARRSRSTATSTRARAR